MNKIYVLDTNILLLDPKSILAFEDRNIIIPLKVIEELDKKKTMVGEIGYNARETFRILKDLKKENLRDNMTDLELILNSLAELTTLALSQKEKPTTMEENRQIAKQGGGVAGEARQRVEEVLGHTVVSPLNATDKDKLVTREMKEIPDPDDENP